MARELTTDQATDLAKHFLGRGWFALRRGTPSFILASDAGGIFNGNGWRETFRAAGVILPSKPQFVAVNYVVMLGARLICKAESNTLAKRIAAALNAHPPNRRGI